MAVFISYVVAGSAIIYFVACLILHYTQYDQEPPTVDTKIPFLGPLISLSRKKSDYYLYLRDKYRLPICTLRLPATRLYVVNSTTLIQAVQRHSRILAMPPLEAKAMVRVLNCSKESHKIINANIDGRQGEWGFMFMFYKTIHPPLVAGGDGLDAMNRVSIQRVQELLDGLEARESFNVALFELVKKQILLATSDAVYGPGNPFKDLVVQKAYWNFEPGVIKLLMGLDLFAKQTVAARATIAEAFEKYFRTGAHNQASALIKAHYDHCSNYNLPLQDLAKLEVGAALGVLNNIVPTTFWLLYHLFSDSRALELCRSEVSRVLKEDVEAQGKVIRTIDISDVKSSCPTLLSSFQETLRLHAVGASARLVMDDFMFDGKFFLKKNSIVLLPQSVQHTDQSVWGNDAKTFECTRFLKTSKRRDPVAFRGFGGGSALCPGRHFATTEVLAYTAIFIMRFDVEPLNGVWVQPSTENAGLWTVTAGPDQDIGVRCRERDEKNVDIRWRLSLSKSDHVMSLVAEDAVST